MSGGYWAGEAIASSMDAARDRAAASHQLKKQQAYMAGEVVCLQAALAALRRSDSANPLLNARVQERVKSAGQKYFWKRGLEAACDLEVDPAAILIELQAEHETALATAIQEIEAKPVVTKRHGWPWNRSSSFVFGGVTHDTPEAAERTRNDLVRLARCADVGEPLDIKSLIERHRQ